MTSLNDWGIHRAYNRQLRHDVTPDVPRLLLVGLAAAAALLVGFCVGYKAGRERPVPPGYSCPGGTIPAAEVKSWSFNRPGLTLLDSGVWFQSGEPFGFSEPGGDLCVFGSGS